jgi:hypothetical protein
LHAWAVFFLDFKIDISWINNVVFKIIKKTYRNAERILKFDKGRSVGFVKANRSGWKSREVEKIIPSAEGINWIVKEYHTWASKFAILYNIGENEELRSRGKSQDL